MANFYRLFRDLLPEAPLLAGTVASVRTGGCDVVLPDGGTIFARGGGAFGQRVFVRDDVIEGEAPDLPVELIEV